MVTDIFANARRLWREGARHGFHRCCRARFIASNARPRLFERVAPGLALRLRKLRPRHVIADGCVPCELHAMRWLLDGRTDHWRDTLPPGVCCQFVKDLHSGQNIDIGLSLEREDIEELEHEDGEVMSVAGQGVRIWWMGIGEERASVHFCPWCGTDLGSLEATP